MCNNSMATSNSCHNGTVILHSCCQTNIMDYIAYEELKFTTAWVKWRKICEH